MPKVKIMLTKLRCLTETDEVGADEPYVLVFAAQIKKVGGVVNIPAATTVLYGPWGDVDQGELMSTTLKFGGKTVLEAKNFWGLDGKAHELSDMNDVIFIVGVMENDDAGAGGIREGLHAQMFASISSYANAGMSRSDMVSKLRHDMRDVLKGVTVTGIPNNDDLVGVAELRFSNAALQNAAHSSQVETMEIAGDGGKYRLRFEMHKG